MRSKKAAFLPNWVYAGALVLGLASCTEPPPPTLSYEDRNLVDSLYQEAVVLRRPLIDSVCDVRFDSLVFNYSDSLLPLRQQEIARQLQRIRQYELQQ